jgi:hypothetical protein
VERGEKLAVLERVERRYPDEAMRELLRELRQRIESEPRSDEATGMRGDGASRSRG